MGNPAWVVSADISSPWVLCVSALTRQYGETLAARKPASHVAKSRRHLRHARKPPQPRRIMRIGVIRRLQRGVLHAVILRFAQYVVGDVDGRLAERHPMHG